MFWTIRGGRLPLNRTLLMGVLNLTPDSFSDGGLFQPPAQAVARAWQMIQEGADILDLGAESTRPGAEDVSGEEEFRRIEPVLAHIRKEMPDAVISIDTTKPSVAEACLKIGAHIINDVSGLQDSGLKMAELVRSYDAGLVIMHRRGNPRNMMQHAAYKDLMGEVIKEISERVNFAVECGIKPDQIVVDPGLGFSKNQEQCIEIIKNLENLHAIRRPILFGASRKSFLGALTGRDPKDRDAATAALSAVAVLKGVQVLRVHAVAPSRDAARVAEALRGGDYVRTF